MSDIFDLVTPDGKISHLKQIDTKTIEVTLFIKHISEAFVGFKIDASRLVFNLKSSLAQLGINSKTQEILLDRKNLSAEVRLHLYSIGPVGQQLLPLITEGSFIGKLFAQDERRRVRDPEYLSRMFGRADRYGDPLLSLGGLRGSNDLILEKIDGRTVAYLSLRPGTLSYDPAIFGALPTFAKALRDPYMRPRKLLSIHQIWNQEATRRVEEGELLLVRTLPLHIRTVFAKVAEELLPKGYHHTAASVLQPDTHASGDVYEFYGASSKEISDVPLEFYTLEPHREHIFFADRTQLQSCLKDEQILFNAFKTAPLPLDNRAAIFIVKDEQLLELKPNHWITREPRANELPGPSHAMRQTLMIERYLQQQAAYPFLAAIEKGLITSEGVLLTRHFPSPFMKPLLLSQHTRRLLKGIYFQYPSLSHGDYFSQEDRALLKDLNDFAVPVFWIDQTSGKMLQYTAHAEKSSGMFVPIKSIASFLTATVFGLYGSNLLEGTFEPELRALLSGILRMRFEVTHPLLNPDLDITLVTGGGPGVMELGNRVAQELGILSCANITDFRQKDNSVIREQDQNRYIDAKMTYHLERLVERQAEFNLDFPIFLVGGIGTDFELALEEVRRKIGAVAPTPSLLFGPVSYWKEKITSKFRCNQAAGTISESEWVSNCFYCVQTAEQGLEIYRRFFKGELPIGKHGPIYPDGFHH